jgi:hypothetical protein
LDLQPENSLIRYAVEQGQRTFVVSWRNPDASLSDKTWDDYVEGGGDQGCGGGGARRSRAQSNHQRPGLLRGRHHPGERRWPCWPPAAKKPVAQRHLPDRACIDFRRHGRAGCVHRRGFRQVRLREVQMGQARAC